MKYFNLNSVMSGVEVPTDQIPTDQVYVIKYDQGVEVTTNHRDIGYKV